MVEPTTIIGTSAIAAYVSKKALDKLLGPTAEYLGHELKGLVKKCNINLGSVFNRSLRMLGEEAEQPGQVSPRVLMRVLKDAPFSDEPVVQEYFAGLLASSRTDAPQDDRAVFYTNLIASLSSSQITFHYHLYTSIRQTFLGSDYLLPTKKGRQQLRVFVTATEFNKAYAISDEDKSFALLEHCIYGMIENALIAPDYVHGSSALLSQRFPGNQISENGFVISAAPLGIDLWLWAHGLGGTWTHRFLDAELGKLNTPDDVPQPFSVKSVTIQ